MKWLAITLLAVLMLSGCAAKQDATQPNYVDVQPGEQTIQERNNELARNAEFEEPEEYAGKSVGAKTWEGLNGQESEDAGRAVNLIFDLMNGPFAPF